MHLAFVSILIALQSLVVLFVGIHNWIPLGALNDRHGIRVVFPTRKLLITTLINLAPAAIGLVGSIVNFRHPFPHWLLWELWIFYGLAVYGSLKAWWLPYLFRPNPELAARYGTMYAHTHTFLPMRNGIAPNTLHVIFDIATIAVLLDLGLLQLSGPSRLL